MTQPDFLETFEASCLVDEAFDALPEDLTVLWEDFIQLTAKHLDEESYA